MSEGAWQRPSKGVASCDNALGPRLFQRACGGQRQVGHLGIADDAGFVDVSSPTLPVRDWRSEGVVFNTTPTCSTLENIGVISDITPRLAPASISLVEAHTEKPKRYRLGAR
jgi:hypothetical protein